MNIENLKKARESAHLTQIQAAKELKISDGTYKNYEQGKREPNNSLLLKIADLYGVTTDYLLGRKPKAPELNQFAELNLSEDDEAEVIAKYMSLPSNVRAILLNVLLQLADAAKNRQTQNDTIQQSTSSMVYSNTVDEEQERREPKLSEQPIVRPIPQKSPHPVQPPIVQSSPQIQQAPQQPNLQRQMPVQQPEPSNPPLQSQIQPEQPKQWRMAARSTDGTYMSRVMKQEEIDLIESLEDVPKDRY